MSINIRRIFKGVAYSSACLIMISVIGSYFVESVDNFFSKKEVKVEQKDVLGVEDEKKIEEVIIKEGEKVVEVPGYIPEGVKEGDYNYQYFKEADLVVEGYWEPEGYVLVNTLVNNPEYKVEVGSIVKDSWAIDDKNTLSIECDEVGVDGLIVPPYWGSCSVKINENKVQSDVRADVYCKEYVFKPSGQSSGCTQAPIIAYYKDKGLDAGYLVLGSIYYGSSADLVRVYKVDVNNGTFKPLFFDYVDGVNESWGITHPSGYRMFYTDSTKKEFRFITNFHNPAMGYMTGSYTEWKVINGRLMVDRKVVSVLEGTLSK